MTLYSMQMFPVIAGEFISAWSTSFRELFSRQVARNVEKNSFMYSLRTLSYANQLE